MNTRSIEDQALSRIYGMGRGNVFTPKDFQDLGTPDAVRAAFSRLTNAGKIRRLLRGVYDYPAFSKLLNQPASPDPDGIAHAIARAHGWTIVPGGATALNLLGLSTQVPAQWEYFGDGPTKRYAWDGGTLVLKRRANKETTVLSPKTALLVQALKTLGAEHVRDETVALLRKHLSPAERKRALREARYVTGWVYEVIKRVAAESEPSDA